MYFNRHDGHEKLLNVPKTRILTKTTRGVDKTHCTHLAIGQIYFDTVLNERMWLFEDTEII